MNPQYLAITPLSPMHIGIVKPGFNFLATREALPGSVIRGALAEYLIRSGQTSAIKGLVENLRISWFFPSQSEFSLPYVLPTTALQCKVAAGFISQGSKGHGVMDSLLPALAYAELERLGTTFPVPFRLTCARCQNRMERISGWYVKHGNFEMVETEQVSQTKVALSRQRRASEMGMLYSVTALRPKVFVGKLWGDDDVINRIIQACQTSGLGGLTGRGYGRVKAQKATIEIEPLRDRVGAFNRVLARVWDELCTIAWRSNVPKAPLGWYFSVDLISPAILRDADGCPSLRLDLSLPGKMHVPVFFATSPEFESGWSTAWGLPKEVQLAANLGSTYVFRVERETDELYETLETLENAGVGDRCDEGYGDVLVCHPFHREVEQI
jgi:CRISPR-associated protein Csx10